MHARRLDLDHRIACSLGDLDIRFFGLSFGLSSISVSLLVCEPHSTLVQPHVGSIQPDYVELTSCGFEVSSASVLGLHGHTPLSQPNPVADLTQPSMHSADHRELGLDLSGSLADILLQSAHHQPTLRFGEASHPGPRFILGTTNPSGAIGKADIILDLPSGGIWNIAETHLALPSMHTLRKQIHSTAHRQHRKTSTTFGAPVPLRNRSLSAGTWAGVMQLSDISTKQLHIPWPNAEYTAGRTLLTRSWHNHHAITGCTVYGWPTAPTWPHARQDTELLLQHITSELILGHSGLRFVAGDFNHSESHLPSIRTWLAAGWIEVQTLHQVRTGTPPLQTYRGTSTPDRIYISPELAQFYQATHFSQAFADHGALWASFDLPSKPQRIQRWPLPAEIPWNLIDHQQWANDYIHITDTPHLSSTAKHAQLGKAYEDSIHATFQQVAEAGGNNLLQSSNNELHPQHVPAAKVKNVLPLTWSTGLFYAGTNNLEDSRVFYTMFEQTASPRHRFSAVLKPGIQSFTPKDLSLASRAGGNSALTNYKVAPPHYPTDHHHLTPRNSSTKTFNATSGASNPGIYVSEASA